MKVRIKGEIIMKEKIKFLDRNMDTVRLTETMKKDGMASHVISEIDQIARIDKDIEKFLDLNDWEMIGKLTKLRGFVVELINSKIMIRNLETEMCGKTREMCY